VDEWKQPLVSGFAGPAAAAVTTATATSTAGSYAVGPGRHCYHSPCHRMLFNSRHEGSKCVSMMSRVMGLSYIAHHVAGCHLTQESRVQSACRLRGGQSVRRP